MMRANTKVRQRRNSLLYYVLVTCILITIYMIMKKQQVTPGTSTYPTKSDVSLLSLQTVMLNAEQLIRLDAIRSGVLTRRNVEIVLSRYNEDISWSDMYSALRTVYDKSNNASRLPADAAGNIVRLPNLGRESYTYLQHIVHNYDNLADVTVFSQATEPTHGYMGHRKGGGHLMANSSFHDFVLNPTGHFIFSGAVWLPSLAHLLRSGYNSNNSTRWQGMQRCPSPVLTEAGGSEYRFEFEDRNHLSLLTHIASRCTAENSTTCSGFSFWNKFIKLPYPKDSILFFSQGAIFSVTSRQVRKRSIEDYKYLLAEVSQNIDPSASFFLEWMWYYVMTSDISPCPVSGHEFDWAKVQPYFRTLQLPKRIDYNASTVAKLLKVPRYSKKVRKWFSFPFF